jgi:alpha-ketoglutaric semialdehyde dehydrogenase
MSLETLTGKSLIGRQECAEGRRTFLAVNPAAGSAPLQPVFRESTPQEADRAFVLADAAFPAYRAQSAESRAAFLEAIAEELLAVGADLVQRAGEETGLPAARLEGERTRTVNQLRMFAGLLREGSWVDARIDRADPARTPIPKPDVRRRLVPIGPVVVFGASNFPLAFSVAGGDTASALAAGNPVVVKGHPAHPGTSEITARAILRAAEKRGMPEGVFSLLQGAGKEIGVYLVRHAAARAVAFTGSLRGGRALFDAASSRPHPIPVYAEMGSANPVFLLPGAIRERGDDIAAGLCQSVTLGVGQFCTNPGLVVGRDADGAQGAGGGDSGIGKVLEKLSGLVAASAPGTMLHAGIRDAFAAGVHRMRGTAGVSVAGAAGAQPDPAKTQAAAIVFSTDVRTFLERPELSEEVFGPSTLVVRCKTAAELEAVARGLDGHLTATVHGTPDDLREHRGLLEILETRVGRIIVNGYPTGVEVCAAMHHGGPYPATTHSHFTSVGTTAILRFTRPVCYQGWPQDLLPPELQDDNPLGIWRWADGKLGK